MVYTSIAANEAQFLGIFGDAALDIVYILSAIQFRKQLSLSF